MVNNAGAFGGEISRVLVRADVFTPEGEVVQVPSTGSTSATGAAN